MFGPAKIKFLDWNTTEDKMWNGIGRYGFIGVITTSTTDISLSKQHNSIREKKKYRLDFYLSSS